MIAGMRQMENDVTERLVLASASPRRRELLTQMGLAFTVIPSRADETLDHGRDPGELACEIAERKMADVAARVPEGVWVLGADTFIVFRGRFMGKPRDRGEARLMLSSLSGNTHQVITGLALRDGSSGVTTAYETTDVTFRPLSPAEIDWYLSTGEWEDVAAAYRIQERGACLVSSITGSPSNVVGLPIHRFYGMLRDTNYPFL